jgi:nicotinate-nucleotide adenylyltransferase
MQKRHANCSGALKTAIKKFNCRAAGIPVSKNAIGVFGGIFDPVHNGHLAVAALARDYFALSRIFFIPSGTPPHKQKIGASAADRLAMLALAIRHEPSFCIRDEELKRDSISYTVDTLMSIRSGFPGRPIYFIIGSDNLREIETWRRYRDILKMVTLCVAHRPGHSIKPPRSLSSFAAIIPFPSPEWGISSSMVRAYLAGDYSCDHLVPASVLEYIRGKKLYRSAACKS